MSNIYIAVLDDYQDAAFHFADWSAVTSVANVTVFNDHVDNEEELIRRLQPYQVLSIMRERTPLNRNVLSRLPSLKLIVSTGRRNLSLDLDACQELGIATAMTGYVESGAPELTWALLMALARNIIPENRNFRSGGWQETIGTDLKGKTLGIVGLGNVGEKISQYARIFGMQVIAWSQNLTYERAAQAGVVMVTKESLFEWSDFITVHLVLSERSKGIIGLKELERMKSSAYFINTSRGPLVDERALTRVLQDGKIAGAALDVFDREPLSTDHPFRSLENILATPHIGYVTGDTYRVFYADTVKAILNWLEKQ